MSGHGLDLQLAKRLETVEHLPRPVAIFAEGLQDAHLEALRTAASAGWMKPILFGSDTTIQSLIGAADKVGLLEVNSHESPEAALEGMVQLARLGGVSALAFAPGDPCETWDRLVAEQGEAFVSDAAAYGLTLTHPDTIERPLFIADSVVHTTPTSDLKVSQLPKLATQLKKCGISEPKIALLAAVEVPAPGMPVTMDAQAIASHFEGERSWYVEGPLSLDLAVSEHAAQKKGAKGAVAGKADLLLAPDLAVARGIVHALTTLSDVRAATVVMGGPAPTALPSAETGADGLVRSIAFALCLASV